MLENLINKLQKHIVEADKINSKISKANIGWHIHHSLKVIEVVLNQLSVSKPEDYKYEINFKKYFFFFIGKFPRGKVRAPKIVIPGNTYSTEDLWQHSNQIKLRLEELKTFNKNQFIRHPLLGILNLNDSIKLLNLHTQHHLNIIKDILNF